MDSFILNNVKFHKKSGKYQIYIKNGSIEKISKSSIVYPNLNQFECNGLFIFPGIFDVYGKVGNPGETFSSFFLIKCCQLPQVVLLIYCAIQTLIPLLMNHILSIL